MPELPEVETFTQDIKNQITGKKIVAVKVFDDLILNGPKRKFIQRLKGKRIVDVRRRGKAIIVELLPQGFLVIQLAMTGHLNFRRSPENEGPI